jgi:hypothetical protein
VELRSFRFRARMRPSTSLTTARCAPLNLRKARLRRSLRKHGGTPLITRPLSSRLLLGKRRLWFATKIGATAATPVDRKSSLSALVAINRRREALRHPPSLTFRRFVARRRAWQSRLTTTTRIRTSFQGQFACASQTHPVSPQFVTGVTVMSRRSRQGAGWIRRFPSSPLVP